VCPEDGGGKERKAGRTGCVGRRMGTKGVFAPIRIAGSFTCTSSIPFVLTISERPLSGHLLPFFPGNFKPPGHASKRRQWI
jgi:hypothetical protein